MIEKIHLANEGSYDATGTGLNGLRALNFIFGPNGSGKTTISRVIAGTNVNAGSMLSWVAGNSLDTRVYNRDFVVKHFDTPGSIRGVYTLGEGNVEAVNKVAELKSDEDEIDKKLKNLKKTLHGDDGAGGKQKERDDLSEKLVEDVWKAKRGCSDLDDAFSGLNNNKKKFCQRYLSEAEKNEAELWEIGALRNDAATVFSNSLMQASALPKPDGQPLLALETSEILGKKIIGKDDVDIAAVIEKLSNSDWVQQGRRYFDQLDDQCPFCQQKTDRSFRQSLEEYFDESYVSDLAAIESLRTDYEEKARALLVAYQAPAVIDSPFLDRDAFESDLTALRLALEVNRNAIEGKKKEPSTPVTLKDTQPLVAAVDDHVDASNARVQENNDTLNNLDARKKTLIAQVWRRLLEDTKPLFETYQTASGNLDTAIINLTNQITQREEELKEKRQEVEDTEKQITSIKPTIEAINKLLKSFGFVNFRLLESADEGFYEVKRLDGEDAKGTLSEGEKSFITFLYFYHHIKGSFSAIGANTDRIVVFDDPVSSLDADILFIVCNLIKGVINEMRAGNSAIKQVFVLTHNIYFHKEITFHKNRSGADAMRDETFWIVRKTSTRSELVPSLENPIKSSYELLWREIRQNPPSETAIQNVMRRIIEHYFKFFGGITPEEIVDKFEGQEKMICASLFSWINDGSHFANDDLFMSCDPGQIGRYLRVFQRIFEESGHAGHYKMMMGDAYVALPDRNEIGVEQVASEVAAVAINANTATAQTNDAIGLVGGDEGPAGDNAP
ncbi:AAA family ATPase [Nisaea sp.]|uniref:AAA family ATPase n=2 Tax=Nisaea sp. TaxID=2024842 RepID=UPI003263F6D7